MFLHIMHLPAQRNIDKLHWTFMKGVIASSVERLALAECRHASCLQEGSPQHVQPLPCCCRRAQACCATSAHLRHTFGVNPYLYKECLRDVTVLISAQDMPHVKTVWPFMLGAPPVGGAPPVATPRQLGPFCLPPRAWAAAAAVAHCRCCCWDQVALLSEPVRHLSSVSYGQTDL